MADCDVRYVGHGWNTGVGAAADLQMAAAFPHVDYVEVIGGSAFVDGITSEPFVVDDAGYLAIPDRPGMGGSLDRDRSALFGQSRSAVYGVNADEPRLAAGSVSRSGLEHHRGERLAANVEQDVRHRCCIIAAQPGHA